MVPRHVLSANACSNAGSPWSDWLLDQPSQMPGDGWAMTRWRSCAASWRQVRLPRGRSLVTNGSPEPRHAHPRGLSSFNDADVMFAQQIIPDHQQAVEMARMAPSQNPKVKQLAAEIVVAEAPEIKTMTGWLHACGKPAPTVMRG